MAKTLLASFIACAVLASAMASPRVGRESPVDVEDAGVRSAAEYVLASANSANACSGLCAGLRQDGELKLVKVVSAKSQVVAGIKYTLELLMEDPKGNQSVVNTSVWSRPWLAAKNDATEPATQITALSFKRLEGRQA